MRTILLIEDNVSLQENLDEILRLEQYRVIIASNGKEGVEKAVSENPDLILCDIVMPRLGGFETFEYLKKNIATAHIPLIFLTAISEKQSIQKGLNMGAAAFIIKPFFTEKLLEEIEQALRKRKRARYRMMER